MSPMRDQEASEQDIKDTKEEASSELSASSKGEDKEAEKEITVTQKQWDELQNKLKETEDRLLRMAADFENSRKRLKNQTEETVKFANEKLVLDILPVVDDLDRAISSLDQGHDTEKVKEGLHLVQGTFHKILERSGVKQIECLNQHFDPNFHEAVGQVEDSEHEEGTIIEEVQRGYLIHGRLARPSRVRITKKP